MNSTPLPLEDTVVDILGKAQRGLRLNDAEVVSRAGISTDAWEAMKKGDLGDGAAVKAVCLVLGLNAEALLGLATYRPAPVAVDGLAAFSTQWDDMWVNSYLVWDPATREAAAFDTGADCEEMLRFAEEQGLKIRAIFITHTHGDHIFALDFLREKSGAPAYVSKGEPLEGAEPIEAGRVFACGDLKIETRATYGHSPAGMTYFIQGLSRPVAVVGDALFAGSMGGANVAYQDALRTNREEIFSLPDETVVAPGHGPLTTVGEERKHNPFFA